MNLVPSTSPNTPVPEADIDAAAAVFSLLADPTRIKILLHLTHGESTVTELTEITGRSQAAVSQHLAKLRLAHMVHPRPEGTKVHYSLINDHARRLVTDALHQVEHMLGDPAHHQEQK